MRRWIPVWTFLTLTVLAPCGASPGAAEPPAAADPGLTAMLALPALPGRWEGSGWIRQGPGEPQRFVGEETVEARLDGRVILVEGRHWTPDRSQVVHHAFAVLSWDDATKGYRFRTHLATGRGGDYAAFLESGALVWEMPSPNGRVRFTIRIEGDRWHEIGTIEREGKPQQFFEMELRRVKG